MPYIFKYPKKKKTFNNDDEKRKQRQKVYSSSKWKKLKAAKLQECPLCEKCLEEGKITTAQHCHHIKSFMEAKDELEMQGLAYDYGNLMSLCAKCHQEIHNKKKDGN